MPVCEECILFGEYPWTYHGIKDERVHYCRDWDAVLKLLLSCVCFTNSPFLSSLELAENLLPLGADGS